jgi:hypothetical protein
VGGAFARLKKRIHFQTGKHGVDFSTVLRAIEDPDQIDRSKPKTLSPKEARFYAIGHDECGILQPLPMRRILQVGKNQSRIERHSRIFTKLARQPRSDGPTGIAPVSLPHHRTCGFPHPAVEPGSGQQPGIVGEPVFRKLAEEETEDHGQRHPDDAPAENFPEFDDKRLVVEHAQIDDEHADYKKKELSVETLVVR